MINKLQRFVNAETLATYLGVRPQHIYALAKRGAIPFFRVGKYLRFPLDEVLEALRGNEKGCEDVG